MQDKLKNLTPQQEKRLLRLSKVLDSGDMATLEYLFDIEEKIDDTITKIEARVEELKNTVAPNLNNILEQVKGKDGLNGLQGEQGVKGDKGDKGDRGDKGDDGKDGKNGKDGRDGRDGRDGLDGVNGVDGNIKDLAPQEIRDSLELLKDDERLDISAIKGVDKSNTTLSDYIINRAIGIVDQRTSFLIQKVSNLKDEVNRIVLYRIYWYRDQSPGLGLEGDVNGVNTDFSIPYGSIESAWVDINGQTQRYPVDYQDISYGGGIIFRFATPPLANDKIFITYCTTVQPF